MAECGVHLHPGNDALSNYSREYLALIIMVSVVEGDEHDACATGLKVRAVDQRTNVFLEPLISSFGRSIVRIVFKVRDYDRIVGQISCSKIDCKLRKRKNVLLLRATICDVAVPNGWIVALDIVSGRDPHKTSIGERIGIHVSGHACSIKLSKKIVVRDCVLALICATPKGKLATS